MNSASDAARIAIGTVQFGLRYGIANRTGQVTLGEGREILSYASGRGADTLDTAASYGSSEEVLGEIGVSDWRVVSKLPPAPEGEFEIDQWLEQRVRESVAKLRVPRLYGMLLHRPEQLREARGPRLYRALERVKAMGLVEKIGVSVYDAEELEGFPAAMPFDLVQVPINVLDRRLLGSGRLDRLLAAGCEVHARSAFLQGLLLLEPSARPSFFSRWAEVFEGWDGWLESSGLSALEACLGYVLSVPGISRVVVGVDSLPQLVEVMRAAGSEATIPIPDFGAHDPGLLNPSLWQAS